MDDIKELLSSLQAIESSGVAGIQNKAKLTAGRNGASLPLTSPVPATQKPRQPELGRLKRAFQAKDNDNEVVPDNTQAKHFQEFERLRLDPQIFPQDPVTWGK